jgi:small-conductance mechanosensitive channel
MIFPPRTPRVAGELARRSRLGFRRFRQISVTLVLLLSTLLTAIVAADQSADVLNFLDATIDWYRRTTTFTDTPCNTEEVLYRDAVRQASLQVLQLGFKFGQAEADFIASSQNSTPTTRPAAGAKGQANLAQIIAATTAHIADIHAQLDALNSQAGQAPPTSQPVISARRDKLTAELNLAGARMKVLQDFSKFSAETGQSAESLGQKIDDLEKAVPEATPGAPPPESSTSAASATQVNSSQAQGIIELVGQLFSFSHRMGQVKQLEKQTEELAEDNQKLRDPLVKILRDSVHRGDALAQESDAGDPQKMDAQRREINTLTGTYEEIAAVLVPLGEQNVVIQSAHENLVQWRGVLEQDYKSVLQYLIVRLGGMATALLIVLGISKIWRKATFRYVTDIRRRRQFLVIRRLVVGGFVIIILVGGVVTEFGSLATYAGLLTAGIAVALQTVILSGVAHFFLIGRFGVRVGDRVTISGTTGDVIEIGIFRLYMMELGGSLVSPQPTGRVVVFSNSVLFQPTPFFKQLPGAEYGWHEVALTLAPDSDYELAEKLLLKAVESEYEKYRPSIEAQHEQVRDSLHLMVPTPHPEGSLRFAESGLEYVVRYPVELRKAAEIDDCITRTLVETISKEPKLKLVAAGTPKIQAVQP